MHRHIFMGVCLVAVCGINRPAFAESHGYLGVMVGIDKELERGPTIQEVFPDSPAAKAGLKDGDEILKVGEHQPRDIEAFLKAVASYRSGERVTLVVRRGNRQLSIPAALAEGPTNGTTRRLEEFGTTLAQGTAYLGITVKLVNPDLQRQARIGVESGVYIVDVVPSSPADKAGLVPGDVITAAGGKLVRSPLELRYLVEQNGPGKEMSVSIIRGNERLTYKPVPDSGLVGYYAAPRTSAVVPPSLIADPVLDPSRRVRELENRVAELERLLQDERSRR